MQNDREASTQSWILLAALFVAYACSSLDRLIIALLVEPIKSDLGATDTQIGMLQGFAFLLVYGIAGLPAGYLADRTTRTRLVASAVAIWSLMTGLCGLANQYWTLFLARAGVAVGEAALSPTAYSLIADSFPPARQGIALALYVCGASLGAGISLMAGGYIIAWLTALGPVAIPMIGTLQPWQMTFLLVAAPGLLIAMLFLFLREPPRSTTLKTTEKAIRAELLQFWAERKWALLFHHSASGLSNLVALAASTWVATLLIRVHNWNVQDVGVAVGAATMIGGTSGMLLGGLLSDLVFRKGPHLRMALCSVSCTIGAVAALAFPLMSSPFVGLALYSLVMACAVAAFASANAALQFFVPGQIRGLISAIYFLTFSIIGSLGPTVVAVAMDNVFPYRAGIRSALAIVGPAVFLLGALCYFLSIAPYTRALKLDAALRPAAA